MTELFNDLQWVANYLERKVKDYEGFEHTECPYGDKYCSDLNYWSQLIYSPVTGWQQILWFNNSPQKDALTVSITYYPNPYAALLDNSIFPAGTEVA